METKWNPIVNGDLSEVPLFEDVLFEACQKVIS